jgi:FkbM family methyltransferase
VPAGFRSAVHRLVQRLGFDVVRYDGRRYLNRRRIELIRARGVNVVLDVGANLGQYAAELRRDGYAGRIVSFEPLAQAFAALEAQAGDDRQWECVQTALGSSDGEEVLNVSKNLWSSSFLPLAAIHEAAAPSSAYVGSERVQVRTIDSLGVLRPNDVGYLKIDVQGREASVLEGASRTLPRVAAVELELCVRELYDGQELLPDLIERMQRAGFYPTMLGGATLLDPASGELLSVDGIFVRAGQGERG